MNLLPFFYPVLAAVAGFFYLRRATIGLENHLKRVALGFFVLSLAELFSLGTKFSTTDNVSLYNLVAPFGPVWLLGQAVLLTAALILGGWVFGYLLKRLSTQLFMVLTSAVVAIFLLVTVAFTALLLKNLQDETLARLATDVKVLSFALESKKAESLSDSQVLAQNPEVVAAVEAGERSKLMETTQNYLLAKKESTLVVVSDSGQVLARGEDSERVGDSLSDEPLLKRALLGEEASSVVTTQGVLAPTLSVRAATFVKLGGKVVGAVMTGTTIDNAFVDGVKAATGLETSIYGDNKLSATTLATTDGKSRANGIKEENPAIKSQVLAKGETFTGATTLLGVPYFAAYLPVKDVDNSVVGMLFVGKPQVGVLAAAGRSIELTFLFAIILLAFSIVPSYFIAKYITYQLR